MENETIRQYTRSLSFGGNLRCEQKKTFKSVFGEDTTFELGLLFAVCPGRSRTDNWLFKWLQNYFLEIRSGENHIKNDIYWREEERENMDKWGWLEEWVWIWLFWQSIFDD